MPDGHDSNLPLADRIEEFLGYLRLERNCSLRTVMHYRSRLTAFVAHMRARSPDAAPPAVATIRHTDIRAFLDARYADATARTRAALLSTLRSFFGYLFREGLRPDNPALLIAMPKLPHRVPKIVPQEVVARLLDAPWGTRGTGLRNRALFELLYGCGLRISEGCGIRLEDLDLARATVRVIGKGDKERVCHVPARAREVLARYLAERPSEAGATAPWLFVGVHGRPLRPGGAGRALKLRAKRLGLPHIWPHRLRAAFATHMLEGGADLRIVQACLGHVDPGTTMHYTGAVEVARLAAVVDRAHPRAGGGDTSGPDGPGPDRPGPAPSAPPAPAVPPSAVEGASGDLARRVANLETALLEAQAEIRACRAALARLPAPPVERPNGGHPVTRQEFDAWCVRLRAELRKAAREALRRPPARPGPPRTPSEAIRKALDELLGPLDKTPPGDR